MLINENPITLSMQVLNVLIMILKVYLKISWKKVNHSDGE